MAIDHVIHAEDCDCLSVYSMDDSGKVRFHEHKMVCDQCLINTRKKKNAKLEPEEEHK